KFNKTGFDLIIYPYRGPYGDKVYPQGYTDKDKELIKMLDDSISLESNKELYNIWIDRKKLEEKVICHMGQFYAKIIPDGSVFRCCAAVNKDWGYLGNLIDYTFNLMDEPQVCTQRSQNCVCFRAMIVGEEEKWLKNWNPC
ncbi:MAG: hypothetical protein NC900_06490, partial [Candidatus Omnitrophica bacterium]|nr:hypothetical protein [Candidatus Omnitrophota bacterium]